MYYSAPPVEALKFVLHKIKVALLFSICILGNKILHYSAPPVEALKFVLHKIKDTTSEDRT